MLSSRSPSLISNARQILKLHSLPTKNQKGVPKGYIAVYVGENEMKRHVVPLNYLSYPPFQDLLRHAEEEFGYDHPMPYGCPNASLQGGNLHGHYTSIEFTLKHQR